MNQNVVYLNIRLRPSFPSLEGKGFLQLMTELVPLYKVPSRETVKLRVDEKYEVLSCAFKEYIRKSDTYCLTYDIWTEQMKNESFMGVTIHFLDNLHLLSGTLRLIELRESHTAAYLGEKLSRLFIEWNVVTDKVFVCITDNDSTMIKMNRNLFGDNKIIPCFAHTINLVVTQAIDKSTEVSSLIIKVSDIVKFIKRSVYASDDLRKKQMEAGTSEGTTKKMILDVKKRWNSCFYMLERFVQLSSFLSEVLLTRPEAPSMVNGSELNNIKEVIELLKSFETVTREISADSYVTVSKIIPLEETSDEENDLDAIVNVPPVTPEDVLNTLKRVKDCKALGPNRVLNNALKTAIRSKPHTFVNLCSTCLAEETFPKRWKLQHLVLLFNQAAT
ncbi:zinc finger BED domain-containing protein 4-like [Anastrepha obliqua]|uniref:zinc finger BED domain-containing protein 4-like n=1 Tax=Anastrepha obliqua TaxID=95512 RepID=UPI0024098539|nr:zinc finger BED domain-containing protein 4-like [Anastrepha obliqua]